MKFAKLSLAALMALGVSAFATDVKVDGDVKVYYGTNDADAWHGALLPHPNNVQDDGTTGGDLFGKHNSYANAAFRIGLTAKDMPAGLTGRLSLTYLDTFGLEDSIVNDTWAGNGVGASVWFDEANLKATLFDKTTVIAGRQYLDTPLVFSEKWNIAANSYDAAVVVDQHIEKTALVAGWIWRSNINGGATVQGNDRLNNTLHGLAPDAFPAATQESAFDNYFDTFGKHGAYAVGAVTSLIPMTTAQAWYYNVDSVADAYWLQADITPDLGGGAKLTFGGQFAGTQVSGGNEDATVWAVKLGGDFNGLKLSAAYSSVDKGDLGFANVGGAQSKLYTEAWWNYGYVSAPDTDAVNVTAEYSFADIADFGAYYTATDSNGQNRDLTEFALTVGKNFGAFDTMLAYVYTDAEDQNNDDSYNTLQVYLTYNF